MYSQQQLCRVGKNHDLKKIKKSDFFDLNRIFFYLNQIFLKLSESSISSYKLQISCFLDNIACNDIAYNTGKSVLRIYYGFTNYEY